MYWLAKYILVADYDKYAATNTIYINAMTTLVLCGDEYYVNSIKNIRHYRRTNLLMHCNKTYLFVNGSKKLRRVYIDLAYGCIIFNPAQSIDNNRVELRLMHC